MKFNIKYSFIFLCAIFVAFDEQGVFIIFLTSAIIHELGHALALYMVGGRLLELNLTCFGAEIKPIYPKDNSYIKEIFVCAFGPISNLIIAYISSILCFKTFSGANLILAIFNLIPIYPLDGGRIVLYFLQYITNLDMTEKIIKYTSLSGSIILSLIGIYIFIITKYNFSILLIGIFLFLNQNNQSYL